MRTPVGSSKIVARSRLHSAPACDPSGVIFTFCPQTVELATASASTPTTCKTLDTITPPLNRRAFAARITILPENEMQLFGAALRVALHPAADLGPNLGLFTLFAAHQR